MEGEGDKKGGVYGRRQEIRKQGEAEESRQVKAGRLGTSSLLIRANL